MNEAALPTPSNRILAALPPADLHRLWPSLKPVELPFRQSIQTPGGIITAAHFVDSGFVSMVVTLRDGDGAEVGLVGNEGMLGLPLLYGTDRSDIEGIVQHPGIALQLEAEAFAEALEWSPTLRRQVLLYAMAQYHQVARTAACNGRHHTEQRLARWLLMAHDRVGGDRFAITHELLSMMLGVRRAGVTVAAGSLQRAGLIRYERGQLEIANRTGLEAAACECYAAVLQEAERLSGLGSL
ncbi:Crp/Fnr family transcriptional regulator [Belnapia sp. T18]|uniref:Crp/Fnr family transcriptional regulator n=1 Tax=Belnapia arida TaxID=2804533 RepID=A0ABS1U8L5_9PROT|nr:Crp/Fnr family transcriptional regulator [Belnapia arida]MBL6081033.1 Crp/Fnr family transcriptional regulator [Belnapia arida]